MLDVQSMFTDPTVQTLIVAGGWDLGLLETAELLRPGATAWQFAEALPSALLRGANIRGSFYVTGGVSVYSRDGEFVLSVSTSLFPL